MALSDKDFETLSSLAGDKLKFEAERARIINEHLNSLPPERRSEMLAFQLRLDLVRAMMTPEEYISYCADQMNENLENARDLSNSVQAQRDAIEGKTDRLEQLQPDNVVYVSKWFTGK